MLQIIDRKIKSKRAPICHQSLVEHSSAKLLIQVHDEFLPAVSGNNVTIDSPDPYSKFNSNYNHHPKKKSSYSSSNNFPIKSTIQCVRHDIDEKSSENLMNSTIRKNFIDKTRRSPNVNPDINISPNTTTYISPNNHISPDFHTPKDDKSDDIFRQTVSPFKSDYGVMINILRDSPISCNTHIIQNGNNDTDNIDTDHNVKNNNYDNNNCSSEFLNNNNNNNNNNINRKSIKDIVKDAKSDKNYLEKYELQSPEGFQGIREINGENQETNSSSFSEKFNEINFETAKKVGKSYTFESSNEKNYEMNENFLNIEFTQGIEKSEFTNNVEKKNSENYDDSISFVESLRRRKSDMTFNHIATHTVRRLSNDYLLDEIFENKDNDMNKKDKNNYISKKSDLKEDVEKIFDKEIVREKNKLIGREGTDEKEMEKESYNRSTRIMKPSPPPSGLKIKNEIRSRLCSSFISSNNSHNPPISSKIQGKKKTEMKSILYNAKLTLFPNTFNSFFLFDIISYQILL